jgi:hypothetical protein
MFVTRSGKNVVHLLPAAHSKQSWAKNVHRSRLASWKCTYSVELSEGHFDYSKIGGGSRFSWPADGLGIAAARLARAQKVSGLERARARSSPLRRRPEVHALTQLDSRPAPGPGDTSLDRVEVIKPSRRCMTRFLSTAIGGSDVFQHRHLSPCPRHQRRPTPLAGAELGGSSQIIADIFRDGNITFKAQPS